MIKLATDEKLHACMFGSQLHVQLQFIDEFKYFQFRSVSVVISSTLSNSQPIKGLIYLIQNIRQRGSQEITFFKLCTSNFQTDFRGTMTQNLSPNTPGYCDTTSFILVVLYEVLVGFCILGTTY